MDINKFGVLNLEYVLKLFLYFYFVLNLILICAKHGIIKKFEWIRLSVTALYMAKPIVIMVG